MQKFYHKNNTIDDLRTANVLLIHRILFLLLAVLSVVVVFIGRQYARFRFGYTLSDYLLVLFTLATGILLFESKVYLDEKASQLLPLSAIISVGLGFSLLYKSVLW